MTLADFIDKWKLRSGTDSPPTLARRAGCEAVVRTLSRLPQVRGIGTNVLNREWDVLVVLDACRYDMYCDVVNTDADWIWSVASQSDRWMERTFNRDMNDTAYVTGNVFSYTLDPQDFDRLDEVWRGYWDDDRGTIMPKPITDGVIDAHRSGHKRVIGHYMQPHRPFVADGDQENKMDIGEFYSDQPDSYVWADLRNCEKSPEEVIPRYWNNLEMVAQELEILKENVDGKIAVTGDHGNSIGEFGIWGHRKDIVDPYMRIVPWDIMDADDTGTRDPDHIVSSRSEEDVMDRLESLGYV